MACICAALENDGLVTGTFRICKCTYCLGRLVGVGSEEIVKPFVTKFL
jgi:hypothetical protein